MWNRSSNFSRFIENFSIIKRLYEEENKDIRFIARWLRMSIANLQLWIDILGVYINKKRLKQL